MPRAVILDFVRKKERWIEQKRYKAEQMVRMQAPKEFVDGEKFLYLGDEYPLMVVDSNSVPLSLAGGFRLSRTHRTKARQLFVCWYRERAYETIKERLDIYSALTGLRYNEMKITNAGKRWGSCNAKGNVHFSYRLIMAPLGVVDYVVVHELVHIDEKNHSSRFWKKVERVLPDYKARRKWLKDNGHMLYT